MLKKPDQEARADQPPIAKDKKTYVKPDLSEHGNLVTLTKAGNAGGSDDMMQPRTRS